MQNLAIRTAILVVVDRRLRRLRRRNPAGDGLRLRRIRD